MNNLLSFSLPYAVLSNPRLVVGLLVFIIANQGIATEPAMDTVKFEATSCWNKVDSDAETDCGWLIVPEDWNAPRASKLKLPVAVFRALKPDSSLSPIIFLAGGPGGHPLGDDGKYMNNLRKWVDADFPGRSMIFFDQRGTGMSVPNLDCPEAQDPMVWWHKTEIVDAANNVPAGLHAAFGACMKRHLTAGRQLGAFNTIQSASDVEALRRALALDDIVLYGLSYGTRLALTVMRHYPEHIESAILDSVYPPQVDAVWNDAEAFGAVLDRLFDACEQHKDCSIAYPDLRGRLIRALERLARKAAIIEISNMRGFEPLHVRVDHRTFLRVLRNEMYYIARLPNLAVLISGVAQGEYWRMKQHIENTAYGHFPSSYTMGVNLAIGCNDDAGLHNGQAEAGAGELSAYLEDYTTWFNDYAFCEFWPLDPETQNRTAVVSEVPSLILAGGLDPATTLEHAEIAAETLSNSHLFVFPAYGHVQLRSNPCAWEILGEFLANPLQRPSPTCLSSLRQPAFITIGGN